MAGHRTAVLGALLLTTAGHAAAGVNLPKDILNQIPKGLAVLASANGDLNRDGLIDWLVVLHKKDEKAIAAQSNTPARPLWLFLQTSEGRYKLTRRNDDVVAGVGDYWQCDSFGDGTGGVVIKNGYFTVEHEIACGAHRTDFITFRYAPDLKDWIFHKRVFENWVMNNGDDANADALKLDARVVETGKGKSPVLFEQYKSH